MGISVSCMPETWSDSDVLLPPEGLEWDEFVQSLCKLNLSMRDKIEDLMLRQQWQTQDSVSKDPESVVLSLFDFVSGSETSLRQTK